MAIQTNPKHHYYCAGCGELVANTIKEWRLDGLRTCEISCHGTLISAATLYQKLHHGLAWLIDNMDDPDLRKFYTDFRESLLIKKRGNSLILTYKPNKLVLKRAKNHDVLDMQADLANWIDSDPPVRAIWPITDVEWDLDEEEVEWFQNKLAELKATGYGYEGIVRPDNVKFVRMPRVNLVPS